MSFGFVIRPEAEQDLIEAGDWYEARRHGLGEEFLLAVEEIFGRIHESPESYPVVYRGSAGLVCVGSRIWFIIASRTEVWRSWRCCMAAATPGLGDLVFSFSFWSARTALAHFRANSLDHLRVSLKSTAR